MGFNSVFRSLKEVFPQVDVRILKAVSIEHSKDADAAVEFILLEVLPSMFSLQEAPYSLNENQDVTDPSVEGVQLEEQSFLLKDQQVVHETNASAPLKPSRNIIDTNHANGATCLGEALAGSSVLNLHGANDTCDQLFVKTETEEVISLTEHQEISVTAGSDRGSHVASSSLIHGDALVNSNLNDVLHADFLDLNERVAYDSNSAVCREIHQEQSCMEGNSLQEAISSDTVQFVPSSVHEETTDTAESELLLEKDTGAPVSECETPGPRGASETASDHEVFVTEIVDIEDESSLITIVPQSGQICRIDLLEDSIRDAKNNKKTLFSAMESIINMMREVEIQEKAAEQAKEEAARGGVDALGRVEDLKQMLQHVKEANDVHAGEVYGEKAILATEVRELQSRLLNLSDERDKSLATLDEMRQTLEARLAAAAEERKAAEQEKLEKEESAQKALAEQELIMEKVVQESKKLQQEAEENTKLQEFVVDRGRIVDILQGEIAVICQDVKLLKEKFDERLPLSKSVSSSQTSCILASSSSSFKSFASDRVPEQAESSEALKMKKTSPTPSIDGRSQKSSSEGVRDDCNEPLDDEWDIIPFEDEDKLHD